MRFAPIALIASMALSASALVLPKKAKAYNNVIGDVLTDLGVLSGTNAQTNNDNNAWLGDDGDYVSEFENLSGEDITLVVWGPVASWVNTNKPLITYTLTSGSCLNVTYNAGISGGFAAIYKDTKLSNGQIFETWGEFTFNGEFSAFDVSREVNMGGHDLSIKSSVCVSDMKTCVFQCKSGNTCWQDYELANCSADDQEGAMSGTYGGAASGGCLVGSKNYVKATFA